MTIHIPLFYKFFQHTFFLRLDRKWPERQIVKRELVLSEDDVLGKKKENPQDWIYVIFLPLLTSKTSKESKTAPGFWRLEAVTPLCISLLNKILLKLLSVWTKGVEIYIENWRLFFQILSSWNSSVHLGPFYLPGRLYIYCVWRKKKDWYQYGGFNLPVTGSPDLDLDSKHEIHVIHFLIEFKEMERNAAKCEMSRKIFDSVKGGLTRTDNEQQTDTAWS